VAVYFSSFLWHFSTSFQDDRYTKYYLITSIYIIRFNSQSSFGTINDFFTALGGTLMGFLIFVSVIFKIFWIHTFNFLIRFANLVLGVVVLPHHNTSPVYFIFNFYEYFRGEN